MKPVSAIAAKHFDPEIIPRWTLNAHCIPSPGVRHLYLNAARARAAALAAMVLGNRCRMLKRLVSVGNKAPIGTEEQRLSAAPVPSASRLRAMVGGQPQGTGSADCDPRPDGKKGRVVIQPRESELAMHIVSNSIIMRAIPFSMICKSY